MKTDSLFYRIFHSVPALFFELIGQPDRKDYVFRSIEVKQTAFRIDGVFLPPENTPDQTVFFVEVQFQEDQLLYHRLFAELFLFLKQNPNLTRWQAVVIFPSRSLEPDNTELYQSLLEGSQVQRFYLNELEEMESFSPAIGLMQLIVASEKHATEQAKRLLQQVEQTSSILAKEVLLELIETTMVYKFPLMSRQEIAAMLGLAESAKHTRVYQEGLEEGLEKGLEEGLEKGLEREQMLVLRQLTHRFGEITPQLQSKIKALPLDSLEELAEALLDFTAVGDLSNWLQRNPDS